LLAGHVEDEHVERTGDQQFVIVAFLAPNQTSLGEEVTSWQRRWRLSGFCHPDQFFKIHSVR